MYLIININKELNLPGKDVWRVLKDFGGHYQFNPLLKLSPIINGIQEGLGAERQVTLYDGSQMLQTILDYDEGRSLLIGFTETELPIVSGTARFTINPVDQEFCHLHIEVVYEPKYGVLGGILGIFYKPVLRYRYNMVVRGLSHFIATGQAVGDRVS